jgi:hypothetical protein
LLKVAAGQQVRLADGLLAEGYPFRRLQHSDIRIDNLRVY